MLNLMIIIEIQIKTTIKYQRTPITMVIIKNKKKKQKMSVGKDVVKNFENLRTGNKNDIATMENSMLPKKKLNLPHNPSIPLLGIYPKVLQTDS